MNQDIENQAMAIFKTFALYGYKKTSMQNIADAIGLSRQGLYKRFASKDAAFDWMLNDMVEMSLLNAKKTLEDDGKPVIERLANMFDGWSGQFVEAVRASPHTTEIMEHINIEANHQIPIKTSLTKMIVALLLAEKISSHQVMAENQAYTLYIAAKGLMIVAQTRREFNEGMRKVLDALFI